MSGKKRSWNEGLWCWYGVNHPSCTRWRRWRLCSWASLNWGQSRSDTCWSSWTAEELKDGTQADKVSSCQWEHPQATWDGGHSLSWELDTADLSPHRHTWDHSVSSLSFLYCWREASGSEMQLLHHCCFEGFLSLAPAPSAAFLVSQTPGVLCTFLNSVGKASSLSRTLCSSRTSLLSDTFPLWVSLCVSCSVWASGGGQEPTANGTYCCIAGARLSGSLPAVWLKGFVWHFRGSLSYPSCLTLGLWSMSVSIWWVAEGQTHEALLNLPLLLISLDRRWQFIPIHVILPVSFTPHKRTLMTLEIGRFIFEVVHGEMQWPIAAVKQFIFHYFPRTTLKIHLCQTELRVEGCKLESGVVETAHTW